MMISAVLGYDSIITPGGTQRNTAHTRARTRDVDPLTPHRRGREKRCPIAGIAALSAMAAAATDSECGKCSLLAANVMLLIPRSLIE
jgi:hypothetical protein